MIIDLKEITKEILSKISNDIFVYPTDTIYGIGCDAENEKLVYKIRKIKNRDQKPLSIIAPSKRYILENFIADDKKIDKYLPGQYTLILKKKKLDYLKHVSENEFVGIRIPAHPFTKIIQELNKPIVTTSVNLSGEKPANKISEINPRILKQIPILIDDGELSGIPSILIKDNKEIKR